MFNHIRHIYFDLDNTLWDFSANSRRILYEMYQSFKLEEMGIAAFESFHQQYRVRNEYLWKAYKSGDKKQEEVRLERFQQTLYDHGIDNKGMAMKLADYYINHTKRVKDLVPGAIDILKSLSKNYPLHVITNGFDEVQHFKIRNAGLSPYFRTVTTAEGAGVLKPDQKIFDWAMKQGGSSPNESLYIGDSPEADGHGSMRAGMSFIWFNYEGKPNTHGFTHVVDNLNGLKEMLL